MKKFIGLSLLLMAAAVFAAPSAEAKSSDINLTANAATELQQRRGQIYQNRRNNRTVRTYVRNVRSGRAIYRETYRVVYRPNGTTRTQLVSRVRIR